MENRLEEIRKKKGVTTTQLAEISGINRYTIYLIEHSKTKSVTQATMVAIANALGVSVPEIFFS